ncbi:GAF domain-containing SpoIIE family protein phosphatase [Streptomyces sp. NPDC028635]|uniref:PP2C family protein-serine/threonine phosphatase n=1 Tax=Streptomyces sp. NPDC028635 TaxID=3154800 RepID=UPI0033D8BA83
MTAPDVWMIRSPHDAAAARTALTRLLADADVPTLDRLRFVTGLTTQLRRCLAQGEHTELRIGLRPATPHEPGQVHAALVCPGRDGRDPRWQRTISYRGPGGPSPGRRPDADVTDLAETLLAADEDTADVLRRLDEHLELVRFHREEMHHTNQGVLALHAELDAAALAQRELLDAERQARAEAENARGLLTFLADASAAVTASLQPDDIVRRLSGLLVPDFAEHLDVWLFGDEQRDDFTDATQVRPACAVIAARTGRPQHAAGHPGGAPGIADLPPSALAPDRALLSIPLTARGVVGVLTLTAPGPRFDPDACVMLIELARRVGIALDHARRYEQHRDVAEALQRAQLTDLPTVRGLRLAARYLPATHGLNIGGDWYDAFTQPDGSLLAVIGDVTGHGLRAAVLMGQLRTALRAYAVEGGGPAEILTRLHAMLRHQQHELYATAAVARFRPGETTVTWAAAGHPPPIVRLADGRVRPLDARPGIMLGVPMPYTYREHAVDLPPDSTLALYTDGLVERRARGIDPGIERLAQVLGGLGAAELGHDLDAAAESVLKPLLHDSDRDDDVCLLLCHTTDEAL